MNLPVIVCTGRSFADPARVVIRTGLSMHRPLLAAIAALVLLFTAAPPAPTYAATDEIVTSSTSVYTAVPDKNQIRVSVTMKITNRIPSTATVYYYVDTTRVWVEAGAKNVKVTTNAGGGSLKLVDKDVAFRSYDLGFPEILLGQTRTITLSYVLPGGAPRSATTDRVNTAYLNFWAFSQPTDTASVRIVVPKAFEMETYGGEVSQSTKGATRVFASGSVDDPTKYWVGVSGSNPGGFTEQVITTDEGRTIRVLGWPGDEAWMTAVRGEAEGSIRKLVNLIGQPLPGTGEIVIRETAGTELGDAYIASFDREEQLARVSEDYSQDGTVTHELAHAWFNDTLFDARWLSEGYASWIERATETNQTGCTSPASYPGDGTPNIGAWQFANPRATQDELDIVGYQYDAACAIISRVAVKVGLDRMRDILGVLATEEGAYVGVPDERPGTAVDWRAWLDAVEERGMGPAGHDDVSEIGEMLTKYGITTEPFLRRRVEARQALADLRDGTAGWAVPIAILEQMAEWDFPEAQAAMVEADAIVETAEAVEAVLAEVDAETGPVHEAYEAAKDADDLTDLQATVEDQLDAATAVAAALAATQVERGFVEQVGLQDVDLPAMGGAALAAVTELDTKTARAEVGRIDAAIAQADDIGAQRIALVVGVTVGILLLFLLALRFVLRRRRRPVPVTVAAAPETPPDA